MQGAKTHEVTSKAQSVTHDRKVKSCEEAPIACNESTAAVLWLYGEQQMSLDLLNKTVSLGLTN